MSRGGRSSGARRGGNRERDPQNARNRSSGEQERRPQGTGEHQSAALRQLQSAGNRATRAILERAVGKPNRNATESSSQRRSDDETAAHPDGEMDHIPAGGGRKKENPEAILARLGPGRPLPAPEQQRMGSAMGRSFSGVRLHAGRQGARVAREVGAKAFAVGHHVGFSSGSYQPGTPVGDALLAHELAHTTQQPSAGERTDRHGGSETALEEDANQNAGTALLRLRSGRDSAAPASPAGGLRLARCRPSESDFNDQQLTQYLTNLRQQEAPLGDNSDIMARAVIQRHFNGNAAFGVLDVPTRILLIRELLLGWTDSDDENAILRLLRDSPVSERQHILNDIGVPLLRDKIGGNQRDELDRMLEDQEEEDALQQLPGWDADSVMEIMNRHGDERLIQLLIDRNYRVLKFSRAWTEWEETATGARKVVEAPVVGNTCKAVEFGCPEARVIRIRASLTVEEAAGVLGHEIEHAARPQAATYDAGLQEEIDVRVANEEFRIRHGIPPVRTSYRNADGTVNRAAIEADVRRPGGHYNPSGRTRVRRWYDDEVEVTGWRVPTRRTTR